jgi:hypothetical protein
LWLHALCDESAVELKKASGAIGTDAILFALLAAQDGI